MSWGPVLVLGGTAEARELADLLDSAGAQVISSLAGRVPDPRLPAGEVRIGGFGGVSGLAEFLAGRGIRQVVDATHPFAAGITANAVAACARVGTPLIVLRRPAWLAGPGDDWRPLPDLASAATTLTNFGDDAAVFLTTGRQGAGAFRECPQRFWLRAVRAPEPGELPRRCDVVLDRGPFDLEAERDFLRSNGIDVLVSKNSGGPMTAPKLVAARELGLPVLMIERPPLPPGVTTVPDVAAALAALG